MSWTHLRVWTAFSSLPLSHAFFRLAVWNSECAKPALAPTVRGCDLNAPRASFSGGHCRVVGRGHVATAALAGRCVMGP